MNDAAVRKLAHQAGIEVNWANYAGEQRSVSPDVLRRVLSALDLPCTTKDDVAESRRRLSPSAGLQAIPSLLTANAGQTILLSGAGTKPLTGRVLLEDGAVQDVAAQSGSAGLEISAIAQPGYHRLLIGDREIVLAVAPARATTIADLAPNTRPWGLAAQVYGLRRKGDGGIGDAAGVARLAREAADRGADALALSPVHALFHADPNHYSPYSPSSRLFLNPLYAAPELVFGTRCINETMAALQLDEVYARLERSDLVDWPAGSAAKYRVLRAVFEWFMTNTSANEKLHADFAQFRADGSALLAGHACFEALHAENLRLNPGAHDWHNWPSICVHLIARRWRHLPRRISAKSCIICSCNG